MWVYGTGGHVIENSEEGNRKIVDGVIKVGSVASSGTPWCCPVVPQVAKSGARGRQPRSANNNTLFIRRSDDIVSARARLFLYDSLINFSD